MAAVNPKGSFASARSNAGPAPYLPLKGGGRNTSFASRSVSVRVRSHRGSTRPSREATIPLVPRRIFFRNPDRTNVQISPDGTFLAWCEPVGSIQNVFVAPATDLTRARQVTQETGRSISGYLWAHTNRHLVILRDSQGTEDYRCSSVDLDSGQEIILIDKAGFGLSFGAPHAIIRPKCCSA